MVWPSDGFSSALACIAKVVLPRARNNHAAIFGPTNLCIYPSPFPWMRSHSEFVNSSFSAFNYLYEDSGLLGMGCGPVKHLRRWRGLNYARQFIQARRVHVDVLGIGSVP